MSMCRPTQKLVVRDKSQKIDRLQLSGNYSIGYFVKENPKIHLAFAAALGGALGLNGRIVYVWHTAREAFNEAYWSSWVMRESDMIKKATTWSLARGIKAYNTAWTIGLATVGGIAYTVGAVATGAVALPVVAWVGYYYFAG
jgi:hypothetical protein